MIELGERSIGDVMRRLGPGFDLEPQMSFESDTGTMRQIIRVPEVPFVVELFSLSRDEHDHERFRRRLRAPFLGRAAWLPTAEDVIITKLRWLQNARREKDRSDAREVLAAQAGNLDMAYIRSWTDRHATSALLDEVLASIPPD